MDVRSRALVRGIWTSRFTRRPTEALGLVPDTAVLRHFETFGHKWVESAQTELPRATLLGIDERSAAVWAKKEEWRAYGPGSVTVIKGPETARFASGTTVSGVPAPARMLPKE